MKFSILKSKINPALNILSGVISNKSVIPIFDHILFEISGNSAILTASDGEVSTSISIDITCADSASFCLPAKLLKESISKLAEQSLEFDFNKESGRCVVKYNGGKGSFEMPFLPSMDFAKPPKVNGDKSIKISAVVLKNALSTAMPFVSQDTLRPVLNTILVDNSNYKVKFVATDANKMIVIAEDSSSEQKFSSLIPPKAAATIEKSLPSKTDECEISFSDTHGQFVFQEIEVIFSLAEGKYPSYSSIVPKDNKNVIKVKKSELLSAISRGELFESSSISHVVLDIEFMGLSISTQDLDFGRKMSETIDAVGGDSLRIGFSSKNLYECINAMPIEDIILSCSEKNKPILISVENDDIVTIAMPVVAR